MRVRRSTLLLVVVWLALLAVYLQVRPAPTVAPTSTTAVPTTTSTTR
ncbi:MAG TPA: hypothetical protein VM933_11450 [Acidimicrobiales bacterium]|nr:hypothetical protein [Acidimicrobiales bacterium]